MVHYQTLQEWLHSVLCKWLTQVSPFLESYKNLSIQLLNVPLWLWQGHEQQQLQCIWCSFLVHHSAIIDLIVSNPLCTPSLSYSSPELVSECFFFFLVAGTLKTCVLPGSCRKTSSAFLQFRHCEFMIMSKIIQGYKRWIIEFCPVLDNSFFFR